MKLECHVRIEDQVYPQHSLKRFVQCNLFVGVLKKSQSRGPQIHLRTANRSYQYKIVNNIQCIRGMNEKNVSSGKATIGFLSPKHYLMIDCEKRELMNLLRLVRTLSDNKETPDVAVMTDLKKPTWKSKTINTVDPSSLKGIPDISPLFISQLRRQYPTLWGAIMNNLQKLELKDVKGVKFPVMLGQLPLIYVSLTNMDLQNDDFLWLNELQIRGSLKFLILSNNKLTEFPTPVIDCPSLDSLDLSHNAVQYVPHGISQLQKLRILHLSHNHLHYLPADITRLKLQNIDLAFNHLHSNVPVNISNIRCNFRGQLRLEDWAALNVDPHFRFQLTAADCPNIVLRKLRTLSRCICDKITPRYHTTEYYVPLSAVKFSASSWIEPQCNGSMEGSSNIYLQYHFCTFQNHCVDRKFSVTNSFRLIKLTS